MALTTIPSELSSVSGIADSSDATAITIDSSENVTFAGNILKTGDLTVDVSGDITLDADGGDINFKDGGTLFGQISNSSGLYLVSNVSDADIFIRGNDGGSYVNALTFDMSAAGAAAFNSYITSTAVYGKDDGNTGIQFDGSDVITLHTGGAERMRFDSAGKVGIGVDPDTLLHVKHAGGSFDEVARLTAVANSANDGAFLGFHGNSTSKFYGFIGGYDIDTNKGGVKIGVGNGETAIADSMTKMTIDNTGKVGIGTTPSGATLHVVSAGTGVKGRFSDGSSETLDIGIDLATNNNHAYIDQPNSGMILFRRGGSPKGQLTAADDWVFGGDSYNGGYTNGYPATNISTSYRYYFFSSANMDARFNAQGSNGAYLGLFGGATRLNNDVGYMVFGSNTNGNGGSWSAYFKHVVGSNAAVGQLSAYTCDGSSWYEVWRAQYTGTNKFLTHNGAVGNISSDQRLKKNIKDFSYSLDVFKTLKPSNFEWINTDQHEEGVQQGFIAQELPDDLKFENPLEEKVMSGNTGQKIDNPDLELIPDKGALSSALGSQDAMYVSVIQQLIARIEALEAK